MEILDAPTRPQAVTDAQTHRQTQTSQSNHRTSPASCVQPKLYHRVPKTEVSTDAGMGLCKRWTMDWTMDWTEILGFA